MKEADFESRPDLYHLLIPSKNRIDVSWSVSFHFSILAKNRHKSQFVLRKLS